MTVIQVIKTNFTPSLTYSGDERVNWYRLMKSLYSNNDRNEMIVQRAILNLPKRTIIITRDVDHVNTLAEMLRIRGVSVHRLTGSTRFESFGDVDVILSTHNAVMCRLLDTTHKSIDFLLLSISIKELGIIKIENRTIQYIQDNNSLLIDRCNSFLRSLGNATVEELTVVKTDNEYRFSEIHNVYPFIHLTSQDRSQN